MSKYDDDEGKGDAKSGRLSIITSSLILNLLFVNGITRVSKDYSPMYLNFIQGNKAMQACTWRNYNFEHLVFRFLIPPPPSLLSSIRRGGGGAQACYWA